MVRFSIQRFYFLIILIMADENELSNACEIIKGAYKGSV